MAIKIDNSQSYHLGKHINAQQSQFLFYLQTKKRIQILPTKVLYP